jgi:hypothetical protein
MGVGVGMGWKLGLGVGWSCSLHGECEHAVGASRCEQGFPQFVLPNCTEYWDGTELSPFNSERQSVVLEMSKQWQQEGMIVHAFAYDPVSVKV